MMRNMRMSDIINPHPFHMMLHMIEEDENYYDEDCEDEYYYEEEYENDNVDEWFRIQNQPIR